MRFEYNPSKASLTMAGQCFSMHIAIISVFLLTILTGCTHSDKIDLANVYWPKDLAVVIPGPEISAETAALSGAWEGQWSNGNASVLVVYRVEKDSARVFHSFSENSEYLPWHEWARAIIVPGNKPRLEWKTTWAAFTFELSGDGHALSGTSVESPQRGDQKKYTTIMTRREIERVSLDRLKPSFACPAISKVLRLIEKEQNSQRRQAIADTIAEQAKKLGTPLVEPGERSDHACAAFIYRGGGREIAISGYMNSWNEQKDMLTRVADSDLFYFCGEYPADSRIEYKLVIDGTAILDPLNPRTSLYGKGSNSEALMPGYIPPQEIEPDPTGARGTVEELMIDSRHSGMGRTATIYLPAGYYVTKERYPVLYLNDAFGVLKFGKITTILDNLIGQKIIPPLIAVFLPAGENRIADYSMNPVFEAFFVEDVIPLIDRRYRTRPFPEFRAVGGISAGATAALSLAIHHPGVFGKCMAQSTATKLVPLINLARTGPNRPITVYLDVGSFESDYNGKDLVDASHRIRDALASHGCPVRYREVNDGHGWANWRSRTREALTFLFGAPDSGASAGSSKLSGYRFIKQHLED